MNEPPSPTDLRFSRHLLLSEIGPAGQRRLLEQRVAVAGDPVAVEVTRLYLERSGLCEAPNGERLEIASEAEVHALAGADDLRVAAAFLAGSFAAVEAIKRAVGAGHPAILPEGLSLDGREHV